MYIVYAVRAHYLRNNPYQNDEILLRLFPKPDIHPDTLALTLQNDFIWETYQT